MTTQSQSPGEVNFKLVLFLSKLTLILEARRGIVLKPLRIPKVQRLQKLHGPSMLPLRRKLMECSIIVVNLYLGYLIASKL